jgi:hypothetical protein
MIYSLRVPPTCTPTLFPNEKFWGHICRILLVWQLSSLFCSYVCFVSTTEMVCEVHVGLLLVCVHVNGVVHNMHNVFTVCFIAMCAVLENASQCHTRVTIFTERTENYVYIFFTARACTVQCLCMGRVLHCTAYSLVTFSFFFYLCVFFSSFHF